MTRDGFLAELLWRRRRQTLAAIGEELCVTAQAVQQWERGKTRPSRMVVRLAEEKWGGRSEWPRMEEEVR